MKARTILVAIDFSESSRGALKTALSIAQWSAGRLTLLHVLDGYPYETVYSGSRGLRLRAEQRAHVDAVNERLLALIPARTLSRRDVDVVTVTGKPHQQILALAEKRGADLIVMGLPRRGRIDELLAGSTVQRVVRGATRAVLVVPEPPARKTGRSKSQTKAVRELLAAGAPLNY